MAQIPRPPKQGNVTTYTAKVAAGFSRILAGEVDADFDTIFGAWNAGADTVNIRDGAVTPAKLSPDAVGPRELQDGSVSTAKLGPLAVTTPKIDDGAVTDPKIVSLAWSKLTGVPVAPTTLPPSGAAGGDLSGLYPAPLIRPLAVTTAKLDLLAVDTPQLAVDAATQFADTGGAYGGLPRTLNDMTETLVHVHTASVASRGGMMLVLGTISGKVATVEDVTIVARLKIGGSPTGVDGTLLGTSSVASDGGASGGPGTTLAFPVQVSVMALVRGTVGQTGPFKLTAQLTGLTLGGIVISDVQYIAVELA